MPFMLERIVISSAHVAAAQTLGGDVSHVVAQAIASIGDAKASLRTAISTCPASDENRKHLEQVLAALA
jgi:hypothetical protein